MKSLQDNGLKNDEDVESHYAVLDISELKALIKIAESTSSDDHIRKEIATAVLRFKETCTHDGVTQLRFTTNMREKIDEVKA
jgi:hypothetical protein